jgi:hypothetical protein
MIYTYEGLTTFKTVQCAEFWKARDPVSPSDRDRVLGGPFEGETDTPRGPRGASRRGEVPRTANP